MEPPSRHSVAPWLAAGPPTGWSAAASAAVHGGTNVPASLALGAAVALFAMAGVAIAVADWRQAREKHGRAPGCQGSRLQRSLGGGRNSAGFELGGAGSGMDSSENPSSEPDESPPILPGLPIDPPPPQDPPEATAGATGKAAARH